MYDVWTHVIQSIIKLHTVQLCSEFKKFKANLNINKQITMDVHSLPWHSGKVLESIDSKTSRVVSSKPTMNVSNFTNRGKKCDI